MFNFGFSSNTALNSGAPVIPPSTGFFLVFSDDVYLVYNDNKFLAYTVQ